MSESIAKRFEEYFLHLQVRNYSAETIVHQRSQAKKWVAFCVGQGIEGVENVTSKHVRDYQVYLYEWRTQYDKPLHVNTQNGNLATVKVFLQWAYVEGLIPADPSKNVHYAKQPKRLPRCILTTTEMRRMLNAPQTESAIGYRDKAFLELLYSTMARRSEMRRFRLTDLDFENETVRINLGKGNKDRTLPMG